MPARPQALSIIDALTDDLRLRIFRGELVRGTRLTETDLAAGYDVARPTAKAAIEKLVAEGLLRRDAHKTARVPSMNPVSHTSAMRPSMTTLVSRIL